jgi:hypothetical protein
MMTGKMECQPVAMTDIFHNPGFTSATQMVSQQEDSIITNPQVSTPVLTSPLSMSNPDEDNAQRDSSSQHLISEIKKSNYGAPFGLLMITMSVIMCLIRVWRVRTHWRNAKP